MPTSYFRRSCVTLFQPNLKIPNEITRNQVFFSILLFLNYSFSDIIQSSDLHANCTLEVLQNKAQAFSFLDAIWSIIA